MPHIHELIDFTVTPIVVHPDGDKVLMVFHPKYGSWMSIGGHVELDQTPDQALMNEIAEECGLEVKVLCDRPKVKGDGFETLWRPSNIDIHDANPPHRHIGLVYYCIATSADFRISDEHNEMRWLSLDEVKNEEYNISPNLIYYVGEAIKVAAKNIGVKV